MAAHITNLSRTTTFHLGTLREFADLLTKIHAITPSALLFSLVLTTVMASYLLYQNHISFAYNVTLQNWAARIIFIVDRRHESSPLLKSLHWLPVKQRITYKLLLYVYNALNGLAPMYISNCFKLYVPKRNLRSSSDCRRLDYTITRNKAGDRTFTVYASKLWNNIPMTLRNCTSINAFKKALKTHLFPN